MDSYIQSFGQYNTIIDGNVIDNAKWNMVYDGDVMDLETQQNNENMYLQLDNKEIMKLFQLPSSNLSIDQRLQTDLNSEIAVNPIIIEEIGVKPKSSRKRSKKHKKHVSHSGKSKSKSKSNPTPDYLKTIY